MLPSPPLVLPAAANKTVTAATADASNTCIVCDVERMAERIEEEIDRWKRKWIQQEFANMASEF